MCKEKDLVSICVITYNSEKTVIETLESIKRLNYNNLELIVSDDYSTDSTIDICEHWIEENKNVFYSSDIIKAKQNTGVTGNVNRACKKASGKYIKIIGADDLLLPDYVDSCISYFKNHENCNVLFTKIQLFDGEKYISSDNEIDYSFFDLTAKEQFKLIVKKGMPFLPTASVMYSKFILQEQGFFDESIPMWEDGPMYFKLTKNGIPLCLLNEVKTIYRISENSLSHGKSVIHNKSIALFYFKYLFREEFKHAPLLALCHIITNTLWYNSDKRIARGLLNLIHRK